MDENPNAFTARELRRQYLREWRRRNPEKVKAYNRSYWERKAQKKTLEHQTKREGVACIDGE